MRAPRPPQQTRARQAHAATVAVCLAAMRVLLAVVVVSASSALAAEAPVRLLLSIGSDLGNPDESPLQHAEDDAQRMRDLFVELGSVDAARALVLKRATATKVTERIAELNGRVAELKAAGRRVELIIFASGHGKSGELHLTGTSLPLDELRTLAKNCGADLTITIIDACESGVSRAKGAAKGPAYSLNVQPPSVTGEVFIASSGASESAQEWDVLSGSLFTHHLISGLRGDADTDADGRVSLMESYAYAERRTVANSVDKGQHPEFAVALEGSSDVVLTALDKGRARVVLDETMEGRFVLVSQPRPDVVTEVTKTRGRVVTLAVPPGRYLLRQARGFSVALQDVELPWGGVSKVDPRRFVTRDFTEVALKGGDVGFHPHAIQLMGGIAAPPIEGTPLRWSVGLGYRLTIGQFWASLSAGWGSARFRGVELWTRDNRFLRAAHRRHAVLARAGDLDARSRRRGFRVAPGLGARRRSRNSPQLPGAADSRDARFRRRSAPARGSADDRATLRCVQRDRVGEGAPARRWSDVDGGRRRRHFTRSSFLKFPLFRGCPS